MADPTNMPTTAANVASPPVTSPPADTSFEPAALLEDAHADFQPDTGAGGGAGGGATSGSTGGGAESRTAVAKQAIKDNAGKVTQQATDKVRTFVDDGKARAGSALDQLSRMLTDAADQVDDKVGAQYGQYARSAADQISGLAETIRNKDVEELVEDARGFVRQSPAVVVGVAAALGFVLARLAQAGVENRA